MTDESPPASDPTTITSTRGLLLVFRAFGTYAIMISCVLLPLRTTNWHFLPVDGVYWACLVALLELNRRAAKSERNAAPWPRSCVQPIVGAVLLWGIAQSMQLIT